MKIAQVLSITGPAFAKSGDLVRQEMERVGLTTPLLVQWTDADRPALRLAAATGGKVLDVNLPATGTEEGYALAVEPDAIRIVAATEAGLFHGIETLCQLIRANREGNRIPCLTIRDWPSLRWRCFQDDLTRGPSTRPDVLLRQLELGAFFKHNLFTYYMEYQYAWKKHPSLGPPDGSLSPEALKWLVEYGRDVHVDILGNQQSFGHFGRILQHPEYAPLRETADVLCPVQEGSYQLLDDLYSEVVPLLPLPFFNVCCDETYGLGEGPSKDLARQIGVGGVYARHLRRIHDLLKDKYGKRMMMWGDIILQHPDHLKEIPKDTIMLTWGYDPRKSFEGQILPFAQSGYDFFVCPGVNNWSRILPDFGATLVNIRNFVRDGVKHGALGMLNTAWDDDGENFNAPSWHGYAWGAECAWNASTTTPDNFNRRIGAVLFGEPGDHFGQAIELLAQTHRLPGMRGMNNARFWQLDLEAPPANVATATRLLALVRPAIDHLLACQHEATANADLLDYFLFGARRMEQIGQRILDTIEAAKAYQDAGELPPAQAGLHVEKAVAIIQKLRDAHAALGRQFTQLWLGENNPYALDWTMRRYEKAVSTYQALLTRLAAARVAAYSGKAIPTAHEIGLEDAEPGARRTHPDRVVPTLLQPDAPWLEPQASHRLGLEIAAGAIERAELPVEVDLKLPAELATKPIRAFRRMAGNEAQEVPAQLDLVGETKQPRLVLMLRDPLAKDTCTVVDVYLGLPASPKPLPESVSTADAPNGMKWLENDQVRLLLGPEGAHLYRWDVKPLNHRDLTMPGETSWFGFADLGGEWRSTPNTLVAIPRGPALVRYRCTDQFGTEKTVSLFAGASWAEVTLNENVAYFWALDDPQNFAADGPTPGRYLFSTGAAGAVGRAADGVAAQVKADRAEWSVKYLPGKLALGLATPGTLTRHVLAPGGGAGGVGIEGGPGASHFVIYGGPLGAELAVLMNRLIRTLDFRKPVTVSVHGLQSNPANR